MATASAAAARSVEEKTEKEKKEKEKAENDDDVAVNPDLLTLLALTKGGWKNRKKQK